jgi:chromosomal replication initiation ATPase DnaA
MTADTTTKARSARGETFSVTPSAATQALVRDVADRHGVGVAELYGRSRVREVVAARFEAIALLRESDAAKWTTTRLGALFNRDHSAIVYALRRAREMGLGSGAAS